LCGLRDHPISLLQTTACGVICRASFTPKDDPNEEGFDIKLDVIRGFDAGGKLALLPKSESLPHLQWEQYKELNKFKMH
jgi:hypothetical protein